MGLALLMDDIISSNLCLKIRVPERSSTVGATTEGRARFVLFVGCPFWFLTGTMRFCLSCLDLACLRSSVCKSGCDGIVPILLLNLQRVLTQSLRSPNDLMNLLVVMLFMLPWATKEAFLVCWSGYMRRMLSWSIIRTTQRMRGLWGWFVFLRYNHMEVEFMCRAKVHAMTNMAGILISSRVMSHSNWALMTVQMLARYAQRWCIALMVVLVVMVVCGPG